MPRPAESARPGAVRALRDADRCDHLLALHLTEAVQRFGAAALGVIDLPPLGGGSIEPAQLRAVATLLWAREVDEAGLLDFADALAEGVVTGRLLLPLREGADRLGAYRRERHRRFTAEERRALYARVFGDAHGGAGDGIGRLVEVLAGIGATLDAGPRALGRLAATALDLAQRLSDRGAGITAWAARGIVDHIRAALELLHDGDIKGALGGFGDAWTLVRLQSPMVLGHPIDPAPHLDRARAGLSILSWLADVAGALASGGGVHLEPNDPVVHAAGAWQDAGGRPAVAVSERRTFDIWHEVPLVPQLTGMSCWAAAAAMIVGWRECVDVDPREVARGMGRWEAYRDGLEPEDVGALARAWGLHVEEPRSYKIEGLRGLLERFGPLWVGEASGGLHVVVVAGMFGDGTPGSTFVRVLDPWPEGRGERYTLSFQELAANLAAVNEIAGVRARILHSGGRSARGARSVRYEREVRSSYGGARPEPAERSPRPRYGTPYALFQKIRNAPEGSFAYGDAAADWQRVVVDEPDWAPRAVALFEQGGPVELELRGEAARALVTRILQKAHEDGVLRRALEESANLPAFAQGLVLGWDDAIGIGAVAAIVAVVGAVVLALGLAAIVAVCTLAGMGVLAFVLNKAIDNDYEVIDARYSGGGDVRSIFPTGVVTGLIGLLTGAGGGGGGGIAGGDKGLAGKLPGPIAGLLPGGGGTGSDPVSSDQKHDLTFKLRKRDTGRPEASNRAEVVGLASAARFQLSRSVGSGGVNDPADVRALKERLIELGFDWLTVDSTVDLDTIDTLRLFQSIIAGASVVGGDGRVDVPGETHTWLQACNAPRWQMMPEGSPAEGFFNAELADTADNHDFGTSWMASTIRDAAAAYRDSYLAAHPGAALLTINDVSLPRGGRTRDHKGHQTGLGCDLKLPRIDGGAGGITFRNTSEYDQRAAREMILAVLAQPLVSRVFFNDPDLIRERLCTEEKGHDDHIHFQIRPPEWGGFELVGVP